MLVVDATNCEDPNCYTSETTPTDDSLTELLIGQTLNYTVAPTFGQVCLEEYLGLILCTDSSFSYSTQAEADYITLYKVGGVMGLGRNNVFVNALRS